MITPNFTLLLWVILASLIINAIGLIVLGAFGAKKKHRYNISDIVWGVMWLLILAVVVFA